jgi:ribonucleoside-diphosphate reductase alpha chain
MKKFIVETYYTCTFKTVHSLNELNDVELSKIDNRKDGEVEVIDVKLNNRKTKKIGDKSEKNTKSIKESNDLSKSVSEPTLSKKKI